MLALIAGPLDCGAWLVEVKGDLDVYDSPHLRELAISLTRAGRIHLVIDLTGCECIDSTGLGVLVGILKRVRAQDGSLAVICTEGKMLQTFRQTGLVTVLNVCGTLVDAQSALSA